jgi:hypothetical protein
MSYRTVEVNKGLARVYHEENGAHTLIGQVRLGLDQLWYAELPGERGRGAAIHELLAAHEAIEEVRSELNG